MEDGSRPKAFTKAVIAAKEGGVEASLIGQEFAKLLLSAGFEVVTIAPLHVEGASQVQSIREYVASGSDLLVSAGGDGTLLKVVRECNAHLPILGVNVGVRGALTQVGKKDLEKAVELVSKGAYTLESRMRLHAFTSTEEYPQATNDIVLHRVPLNRTPCFTILYPPSFTVKHRMDGLVISTPLGSTGHSLSLRGPVVHEALDAFVLTPIAPLEGLPSLVLPCATVTVSCDYPMHAVFDGQKIFRMGAHTVLQVRRADRSVTFVKLQIGGSAQMDCLE